MDLIAATTIPGLSEAICPKIHSEGDKVMIGTEIGVPFDMLPVPMLRELKGKKIPAAI